MELRTFVEPQQGTSYDALAAHAVEAERLGFDGWFTSDHLLRMGSSDGLPGPTDAWTTLAGLARDTDTIRLGTLVTPITFRHPGHFAVQVAQVDHMSGGRVEVGLGSGWYDAEHEAMAIPFPDLGGRFDRFEEYATIVTGIWGLPEGELFDHDGEHYTITDNPGLPKPRQRPRPPIIIGGRGRRRTPRLAATVGAEWNGMFTGPDDFADLRDNLHEVCAEVGRDADDLVTSNVQVVCVGRDEDEFRRRAAVIGREPDELRANGICGLPDEARARLATFAAVGCTRMYLQTLDVDDLDHLALLAETLS